MDDEETRTKRASGTGARQTRVTEVARRLYQSLFTPEERVALSGAARNNDLEQELELLRVLIQRAVADGQDLETVSKAMGRLGQMLRIQHALTGDAARGLDEALAKVLAEIGAEIGI